LQPGVLSQNISSEVLLDRKSRRSMVRALLCLQGLPQQTGGARLLSRDTSPSAQQMTAMLRMQIMRSVPICIMFHTVTITVQNLECSSFSGTRCSCLPAASPALAVLDHHSFWHHSIMTRNVPLSLCGICDLSLCGICNTSLWGNEYPGAVAHADSHAPGVFACQS